VTAPDAPTDCRPWAFSWTQAAVLAVTAAHFINTLPTNLNFARFAFGDYGWALTTDAMLSDGLRPVQDFSYFYGLLTLLINKVWFFILGRTPVAMVALYAVCGLATAIGITRVMAAVKLRGLAALYLVATAVFAVMTRGFPSPAHALEAALVTNALADHASGRPGRALVLATVTVFVKPSLGYIYGLILLLLILSGWPDGRNRWRPLLPAAITGTLLAALLASVFGGEAVLRTQIPLDGMRAYRDAGFGFLFGSGRQFWYPAAIEWRYYVHSVVAVWLASSVVLWATAIRLRRRFREPAANVVLTCASLHGVFVFALFGNQYSWIYYPYILFVGTAVALGEWQARPVRFAAIGMMILALIGQYYWVWEGDVDTWSRSRPTAGLYAEPEEAEAWAEARQLAKNSRVFVLTRMGCPHLLAPEMDSPQSWCLIRATVTPAELGRVRQQIRFADYIISVNWHDNDLMSWPEFAEILAPFRRDRETPLYILYRRMQ
jgi:hypothetical protein